MSGASNDRPRPPIGSAEFIGSMQLDADPHRAPGRLATWFPHPDPWPGGWPQVDGWTGDSLADLRAAPTWQDEPVPEPAWSVVPEPEQLELSERLGRKVRAALADLDPGEVAELLELPGVPTAAELGALAERGDQLGRLVLEVARYQRHIDQL